jgi:hypothetical protein
MSVLAAISFIEQPSNTLGQGGISSNPFYQYCFGMRTLPDRWFSGPVKIAGFNATVGGFFNSTGGAGIAAFALDRGRRLLNQANYPLTQNGDFGQYIPLLTLPFNGSTNHHFAWDSIWFPHPIEYRPGLDCISMDIDADSSLGGFPVSATWTVYLEMDRTPNWPNDMPDAAGGGNDINTLLLLHGSGPTGLSFFQDNSWRNRTVRYGGAATLDGNGYFNFPSEPSYVAPEMFPPGYGLDLNPAHSDWNVQAHDWTLDLVVHPTALPASYATIATQTAAYSPIYIGQTPAGHATFNCSQSGTGWDVASTVDLGAIPLNADTHLAAVRHGNQILLFNNGVQIGSAISVSGALFCPTYTDGSPAGRLSFGCQLGWQENGTPVGITGSQFIGKMKEIRFSNVARWTANFTSPSVPYSP